MKTSDLLSSFSERADQYGVVKLTVKQINFLCDLCGRERKDARVSGALKDRDGHYWKLTVYPNHAGFIKRQD